MTDEKNKKSEKVRKPLPRKKNLQNTQSMEVNTGGQATQGTHNGFQTTETQFGCSDEC